MKRFLPVRLAAQLLSLAGMSMLVLSLAACGSNANAAPGVKTVLSGTTQNTTYTQVSHAIDALYRSHPDIRSFQVQAVEYTPRTRDKVLKVCREGSIALTARELETQRVMACAPLIYFLDRYGVQNSTPQAMAAARRLYQYAVTHNRHPYDATKVLTDLLRSWGVK